MNMAGRLALAVREAGAEQNGRERECVRWKKKGPAEQKQQGCNENEPLGKGSL